MQLQKDSNTFPVSESLLILDLSAASSALTDYFLKKSGILMDCSFTLLVGVLGVSKDGAVPPTGRLGIAEAPPFAEVMPKSSLGEA